VAKAAPLPRWDSGSRRTGPWFDVQYAEIRAHGSRLDRVERWLRKRYHTNWPKKYVDWFTAERHGFRERHAKLDDQKYEPWFPKAVIQEIEEQTDLSSDDEEFAALIEALWDAASGLDRARRYARQGMPRLDKAQRRRLTTLTRSIHAVLKACGPDDEDIATLIRKQTFHRLPIAEILQGLASLSAQVEYRLHQSPVRPPRKPKDVPVERFYQDVVFALDMTRAARRDEFGRDALAATAKDVTDILLESLGERRRKDPKRLIRLAVDRLPKVKANRRRAEAELRRFLRATNTEGAVSGKPCP
jgi:hypothetical protein